MTIDLCGYQVSMDEKATQTWYASAGEWGCKCGHCRNFLSLAQNRGLPATIIEMLDGLGIPLEKATYVCELYTDDKGIHYQFSYRIAGEILEESVKNDGKAGCCHDPYPYGAPGFPEPHFDLEFYETLPWVLQD